MGSCASGAVFCRVMGGRVDGKAWCVPCTSIRPDSAFTIRHLDTYEGWTVKSLKLVCKHLCREFDVDDLKKYRTFFLVDSPSTSLIVYAARRGFKHMTCQHLRKLIRFRKMKFGTGEYPRDEVQLVKALAVDVLGLLSDDDLGMILAARGKEEKMAIAKDSVIAQPGNAEILDNGLEEMDVKEDIQKIKKTLKQLEKPDSKDGMQSSPVPSSSQLLVPFPSTGASSSSGSKRKPPLIPVELTDDVLLEEAKPFAPRCAGCLLYKDVVLHSRWHGTHKRQDGTKEIITKSWGPHSGSTVSEACATVLQGLWAAHEFHCGEKCPFSFA